MPKSKVKPGITIDKEVWEQFKKNYPNASETIEALMREANHSKDTKVVMNYANSVTFQNATDWSISYSSNSINLTSSAMTTDGSTNESWSSLVINSKGGEDEWK